MERKKNINSLDVVEVSDIYLQFSGLLNHEKYGQLLTEEIKEWVEEDTKRRANEWINRHFKDEPFNGMLYIDSTYVSLDYSYDRKVSVNSYYVLSYVQNKIMSCSQDDFKIIPVVKD